MRKLFILRGAQGVSKSTLLNYIKKLFANKPRTEWIDPQSIQFSTPSLNNELGLISSDTQTDKDRLIISGDNWRHTEFIHQSQSEAIETELQAISDIHKHHKASVGWDKVYVRSVITEPLMPAKILSQTLYDLFPNRSDFSGVAYWDTDGVVDYGFAFRTEGGLKIYGQYYPEIETKYLRSICFEPCSMHNRDSLAIELKSLSQFAKEQELHLVCWNKVLHFESNAELYLEFFEQHYHD